MLLDLVAATFTNEIEKNVLNQQSDSEDSDDSGTKSNGGKTQTKVSNRFFLLL